MKFRNNFLCMVSVFTVLVSSHLVFGQTPSRQSTPLAATATTAVPALIPFSGLATTAHSKPLEGELAMTFQIFMDETGGEALFSETQMITIDSLGHYTAHLGASLPRGLPDGLFASGQARWLEVQIAGQPARARILLASVPYALKSEDAETLGGLPASAFVLAGSSNLIPNEVSTAVTSNSVSNVTTTGGTTNKVAKFSGSNTIVSSVIYDNGTDVGIGTASPTSTLTVVGTLTVSGASTFNGSLSISPVSTATSSASYDSQQLKIYASVYNSSSKVAVSPHFIWQAEPTGNNTSSPGATLNLLATAATSGATETGFYFNTNGTMHFASGQTFPSGTGGGGSGTITGVTAGTALTGGGTTGKVTLNVDTTKVPLLASNNTFTGSQTVNGDELVVGGELDITNSSHGQLLLVEATADGSWGVNSFGGPNGGLAGRFIGGGETNNQEAGAGLNATGGESSDTGAGGVGAYIYGGNSYQGAGGDGIDVTVGNLNSDTRGYAGDFTGDVAASGDIIGAAKYFRIDHPLDPANKYLNHTSTESSEMMNIYSGNVTTDDRGLSTVSLPEWFETINTDFRYQLTVVGQFAQAIIKSKVAGGHFTIMTNAPGVEVSWMITAVRQDRYAKAHPITVEQAKPLNERGFYLHPELYGQPKEKQTEWGRHPQQMKQLQGMRNARRASPGSAQVQKP